MSNETPESLAYDVPQQAIGRQMDTLNGLRSRAGTLLAAAALVASFFGPTAFREGSGAWALAGAVVSLMFVLGCALAIVWPYEFRFGLSATVILDDHAKPGRRTPIEPLKAFLARALDERRERNQRKIRRLLQVFQAGCICLAVETVALSLAV